jgi:hypothetical protein
VQKWLVQYHVRPLDGGDGEESAVEYPEAYYHVMARGNRREEIFLDEEDRQKSNEWICTLTPSLHPMNEAIDESPESIFTPVLHSGPLQLLLTPLIVAIGIYHITLSVRTLLGSRSSVAPGVHAVLLFAGPCLLILSVAAMLPTTVPKLFVVGIDEDEGLKHTLRLTSFLGWLCLGIFVPSFVLCLLTLKRNQRSV